MINPLLKKKKGGAQRICTSKKQSEEWILLSGVGWLIEADCESQAVILVHIARQSLCSLCNVLQRLLENRGVVNVRPP